MQINFNTFTKQAQTTLKKPSEIIQTLIDTSKECDGFLYLTQKYSDGHFVKKKINIKFPR